MKKLIFTLAIATFGLAAGAQDKASDKTLKFSVGVEAGLPLGDIKEIASIDIGGSLQNKYIATKTVGITLSADYLTFSNKSVNFGGGSVKLPSTSIVPVLAGAKFYFSEKFYGHAQAGLSFFNNGGGSAFTYAPALGVMASENIDISLKYQGASKTGSTISFIGLRVAYGF